MNYSYTHQEFARHLKKFYNINEQDVLSNPENYLGPNYREILNQWFYLDSLSSEQKSAFWDRYSSLNRETYVKAHDTARKLAEEVIAFKFVDHLTARDWELMASHLYIERGIPFTFLP